MEIRDFVRRRRWALALLVVLPVLAAGATYAALRHRPALVEADGTLQTPPSMASSDSQIGLYVSELDRELEAPAVVTAASDQGVSARDLRSTLSASRVGTSSTIAVSFRADAPSDAALSALRVAIRTAAANIARQTLPPLQRATDIAEKQVAATTLALSRYEASIGTTTPEADYQRIETELVRARAGSQANGRSGTAVSDAAVQRLEEQLATAAVHLQRYSVLDARATAARAVEQTSEEDLVTAQARAAEDGSGALIQGADVVKMSRIRPLVESVLLAAALGFVLGLALLLAPDVLRRRNAEALEPYQRNDADESAQSVDERPVATTPPATSQVWSSRTLRMEPPSPGHGYGTSPT